MTVKLPSIVFVVTTQGKAEEVNAVGKVMVAYVYTTSAREYTMQGRIGKVPFILGVMDYTMQARIGKEAFILGDREYTMQARIGKVPFILGVREYTMQARIDKVLFMLVSGNTPSRPG